MADCRRQFERTACQEGEDPSICTIALETLAVKAFGDADTEAQSFGRPGLERVLPPYAVDEPGRGSTDRMVAAVTVSTAESVVCEVDVLEASPAVAGTAFLAEFARVVTVGVASLADAGAASLAHVGVASRPTLLGLSP